MGYRSYVTLGSLPRTITASEKESLRFGISVGRVDLPLADPTLAVDVLGLIRRSGLDLTVVRVDAQRTEFGATFEVPDLTSFQADTLVYFERDLTQADAAAEISPYLLTEISTQAELEESVRATFAVYDNHYTANPLLDRTAALEGYAEWARSFVAEPGRLAFMMRTTDGTPVAHCAVVVDGEPSEIALAGVHPADRGKGVYRRLLESVHGQMLARGSRRVVISTQIANRTAIRTWIRSGYQFGFALNTHHVMTTDFRDGLAHGRVR